MGQVRLTNFASATIATAVVNPGDLTFALSAGQGALFPATSGGDWFYVVAVDSLTAPTKREVIKVTGLAGDTFTSVLRAQDGTTAQSWAAGNNVELRLVNAVFTDLGLLYLKPANNLSDILSASTARTNLGLGSAATLTTAQVLQAANNLSDLANVATARSNLGLGSAALLASSAFFLVANNLSEGNAGTMRTNLGLGTIATQPANNIALTGGTIGGVVHANTNSYSILDGNLTLQNTADATKQVVFSLASVSAGVTRTWTFPDLSGIFVGTVLTQTLTNKTISGASNTLTAIGNASLTNSSVTIGSDGLNLGGTLATLHGVTIDGSLNTLNNVGNSSLANNQITIGSTIIQLGGTATTFAGLILNSPTIDTATITGTTTLPGSSQVSSTGELGVRVASRTDTTIFVGIPSGAGTSLNFVGLGAGPQVFPSTCTNTGAGVNSNLATAVAAFTLSNINHFFANSVTKGAGSTITNVRGFYAANAIAKGTNNYGFYSDIAQATTTWQFYGAGTGESFFGGPVGILSSGPLANSAILFVSGTHPSTQVNDWGIYAAITYPSTCTNIAGGFMSQLATTAAAFTCSAVVHFYALTTSKGAGSTITSVMGFRADNSIVNDTAASTTYGFYSALNKGASATVWAFNNAGTAPVGLGDGTAGSVRLATNGSQDATAAVYYRHPGDAFAGDGAGSAKVFATFTGLASSVTTSAIVFDAQLIQNNAVTLATMIGFKSSLQKNAGATVNNAYCFYALGASLVAATVKSVGYFSDIASGTNYYQLAMDGTADSRFGGPLYLAKDGKTTQANCALYAGSGAPNNANGNDGDIYHRSDGGALTTIYQRRSGTWTGIV